MSRSCVVVEAGEPMGQPGDAVAFAAAGGVLDQVVVPRPLGLRRRQQLPHGVELMVAGEDDRLLADLLTALDLLIDGQVHEAGEDVEPSVALARLPPRDRPTSSPRWDCRGCPCRRRLPC